MKAILLVAGYATRLFPLTKDRPKALLEFWGKPILTYIFENMCKIKEIDEVFVVSNNRFYPHFQEWANGLQTDVKVNVINDGTNSDDDKLGAVGDLHLVLEQHAFEDDFMVLVGDNLFTYELKDFYDFHRKVDGDCICTAYLDSKEELQRMGVVLLDENGRVTEFAEKPKEPKSNLAAYGAYIYKNDTLPLIRQYVTEGNNMDAPGNLPAWLCQKKPVYAFVFEGACFDIGTVKSYHEVMDTCKELFVKD